MFLLWISAAAMVILAYLIGSVSSSIIISKLIGTDIRQHGSGNAGATNMLRTYGKKVGVLTLICDALKGIAAILLAMLWAHIICGYFPQLANEPIVGTVRYICAVAVVLGHNYPIFFQFKGGKGIATSGAVIFMLDWRIGIAVLAGALLFMALTRYISLGSIVGAIVFPTASCIFTFFIDRDYNIALIVTSVIMGALAIYRHHANIARLFNGTESKIGSKNENYKKQS